MSDKRWGSIYIGRKLVFRLFLALGLFPVFFIVLFFSPLPLAILGLLAWLVFCLLSFKSTWQYIGHILQLLEREYP